MHESSPWWGTCLTCSWQPVCELTLQPVALGETLSEVSQKSEDTASTLLSRTFCRHLAFSIPDSWDNGTVPSASVLKHKSLCVELTKECRNLWAKSWDHHVYSKWQQKMAISRGNRDLKILLSSIVWESAFGCKYVAPPKRPNAWALFY